MGCRKWNAASYIGTEGYQKDKLDQRTKINITIFLWSSWKILNCATRTNASKWNTYACPLSATPQPHTFTARTTRWEINCTSFDDDATKSVAESVHRKTEPNGVDARWVVTLGWLQKWTCVCIRVTSRWRVESQYQINRTVSFRIAMTLSLFIYEKTKTFLFVQHKMVTQMMINIIQLRKWKEIV